MSFPKAMSQLSGYWAQGPATLVETLSTSLQGLPQEEAEARLEIAGQNQTDQPTEIAIFRLALRQFESPLVIILLFGAGISLLARQWADALIILLIVLGSTVLGFTQEYRASTAIKRLRNRLAFNAIVLRDGRPAILPSKFIVPGDVVLLAAGNLVPADGVILEARDFLVTQAALTGESMPVEKTPGPTPADASLSERSNVVLLGTSVRSGTAKVLVIKTGKATELGAIARDIAKPDQETDFERGIRRFGYLLTRVMTSTVLFVLVVNLMLERPLIESLLFAAALAVGLTPELLPAIVSVTLSAGARNMARQGVLVRRLDAIENLGGIDVLCTDKTGTLTKGCVEVSAATDPEGHPSDRVFRYAAINADLETGIENALDAAIVTEAERREFALDGVTKIDEIPYDFIRKCLTIVVAEEGDSGSHLIVTKGAFDAVIGCCDRVARAGEAVPLAERRQAFEAFYRGKSAQGFRVLGLATKRVPAKQSYTGDDEAGLVFQGFLLFFDPIKEGIEATIRDLVGLGVATKIISGDNRYVAAHVGEAIGLDPTRLLTGHDLHKTQDEGLWNLAERTDIFAEIAPQQKERIVRTLQKRGHVVAFLGDGINDGPALRAADVGISVDQAVDIARESADVVLLERDLTVLKDGVIAGRRTFANTLKYIAVTTSANFGNMISMAAATLFVPFLPLLAKQILLNNFVSDFPSIAISTDKVDPQATDRPQRWDIGNIQSFMLVFGLISTVFDLITFAILLHWFQAGEALFQTTWFVVSLLTELAVVLVLRTHLPSWRSAPSRVLLISTIVCGLIALILPYTGAFARACAFVPLPGELLVTSVIIVCFYIAATEAAKSWYFRQYPV
jgi:Mg2+-importing ATPase